MGRLGLLGRPILLLQMGLNVGFCCSLQCSSPGSSVIAGDEDREVREKEEERRKYSFWSKV
jgi:hypothetical protein